MAILSVALTIGACGASDPDEAVDAEQTGGVPGATNEDASQDFTTFDVEWKPDAVVIDDVGAVQASLVGADFEAGQFVFDPDLPGLEELTVDSYALIGGVGIFRILEHEEAGDVTLIVTEPAKLTDVIEDGTIAWRRSFISADSGQKLGLGLSEDEDEAQSVRQIQQPLGSYEDGTLEYSGNVGGFDTTFSLSHKSNSLDVELQTKYSAGNVQANAVATAHVRGLTNETNIEIAGGSLTDFTIKLLDVEGDVSIKAGGAEIGLLDQTVKVPARLSLPILVGGIPFKLDLGGSLEWSSTLTAQTSAIFDGSADFKGGVGARYTSSGVEYLATFDSSNVEFGTAEHVGTITAGLGMLVNFPEVGFGIGVARLAEGGAAFKFKTEVVSNFELFYEAAGTVPVITGNCLTSSTNFGATLSGQVAVLGITLAEDEVWLFSEFGEESKSGNRCE